MPYDTSRRSRKSPRLWGFDYTKPGWYFVTICTAKGACMFGDVVNTGVCLNSLGRIADEEWHRTADLRENVRLGAHVVMPNHVHGLIGIADEDDALLVDELRDRWNEVCRNTMDGADNLPRWRDMEDDTGSLFRCRGMARHVPTSRKRKFAKPITGSLSTIVGAYKSAVTKRINRINGTSGDGGSVWQTRFHDRIIRNAQEWYAVRQYIKQNPAKWEEDRFHPEKRVNPRS